MKLILLISLILLAVAYAATQKMTDSVKKAKIRLWAGELCIIIFIGAFIYWLVVPEKNSAPSAEEAPLAIVHNSPIDGSVMQCENYIKERLKDPSSYESVKWTPVQIMNVPEGKAYQTCGTYRAKNSFGAYDEEQVCFTLDMNGNITNASK